MKRLGITVVDLDFRIFIVKRDSTYLIIDYYEVLVGYDTISLCTLLMLFFVDRLIVE